MDKKMKSIPKHIPEACIECDKEVTTISRIRQTISKVRQILQYFRADTLVLPCRYSSTSVQVLQYFQRNTGDTDFKTNHCGLSWE